MILLKSERNSNIECLRIVSIFMVLVLHYLNGSIGGALDQVDPTSLMHIVCVGVESFSIAAVNIFVIISGYFLIDSKKIKTSKIVSLYGVMVLYTLISFTIAFFAGETEISLRTFCDIFFPFIRGKKWFVQTYLILYIFSPFLNKMLNMLGKKEFQMLIIMQLFFFSLWPSFFPNPPSNDYGYGIVHFITLYSLAGYIKRFLKLDNQSKYMRSLCGGGTVYSVVLCF